ncbi:putative zinc finger protein [Zopfia rhizophila CBS 207.26]|uniref:Putative zinc finger protein n=1 Tax=Zopfia rhizophila CBS 207.26 TaxID=1314779 RepID=A0A6A6DET2_9PEZI|nr:putative zinc finger protein [Zopfia rhizophila CBS 207.26]
MANSSHAPAFERALEEFRKGLKKRDQEENFKKTTFDELKKCIGDLQTKQHSLRRLQNLNRLKPFLEAMEQYGKVVTIFCNSNDLVAFVWVASSYAEAFGELLDTYEHIGENLPLFLQYENLFHAQPHTVRVLTLMYEDILKFHRIALRYFQQPLWKQLFDATWKTYKSRFSGIISNMARHRNLIESQASLSQIEAFQESRRIEDDRFDAQMRNENLGRSRAVYGWLKAANVDTDQYHFSKIRADYPGTGKWLLDNSTFKDWFNHQFPMIPPLLWLNGIPGAGKTILASLVVEEVRKLKPLPTVLFFYCKHKKSERDNFLALARSLLAQLLKQDKGLLLYFYQKCCDSGEAALDSPALVDELLTFAFQNCKSAYIILDGLDECAREERKKIVQWFRRLVEDLPTSEPERFRCLFVSQDDGVARKDFSGLTSIKIRIEDNKHDIDEYCRVKAENLKGELKLTEEKVNTIASTVANSIEGMFLLAKLIWINLSGQTSIRGLEEELKPQVFPTEINKAYERIMVRIKQQASPARIEEVLTLLGWLVCAKRSLKWHEIQGLKAINLDEQFVDHERQKFLVAPKDLCESLVEIRSDGTLELVHLTAKFFLVDQGHVDPPAQEIKLASLCVDYLNLPVFVDRPTGRGILNGDYASMDYAVLYWIRHLEAGVLQTDGNESLMKELAESLEIFIDQHWTSPNATFIVSKRNSDRLQFFKDLPFYEKLEQTIVSTRKQLTFFGKVKKDEIALDLADIVSNVREVLEQVLSSPMDPAIQNDIELKYGNNLFRCPRFSCQFFSTGFPSADERDIHVGKHDRPFPCAEETCPGYIFGFTSAAEREKHMRDMHPISVTQDQEFPTDQDIHQSLQSQQATESAQATASVVVQKPEPDPEPQNIPTQSRSRQEQMRKEFKCYYCSKILQKDIT